MLLTALLLGAATAAVRAAKIEYWYINMGSAKHRSQCIERQLKKVGLESEVHRYPAMSIELCEYEFTQCFRDRGLGDCISGGLDWGLTGQHGSGGGDDWKMHHAIVSNWCGHKRLFRKLAGMGPWEDPNAKKEDDKDQPKSWMQLNASSSSLDHPAPARKLAVDTRKDKTASTKYYPDGHDPDIPADAEYFVVMEDDVVVDQQWFKTVVEDFVDNYDGPQHDTWDLVQMDPFGGTCDSHVIANFRDKKVWEPHEGTCPGQGGFLGLGGTRGDYWGLHAILLRKSTLHRVVEWMDQSSTVPVDWIQLRMPNSLAYEACVARNPEATRFGWDVQVPEYCSSDIMQTTIGFTQFEKDENGKLVLK